MDLFQVGINSFWGYKECIQIIVLWHSLIVLWAKIMNYKDALWHNNWNKIFVLHINTTTACDIQDILFSFLYSCHINSCHLSFLSQYSSNIWTVNTSTYNFSILISDLGCHKLWWYLCVKQKSDFNCCALKILRKSAWQHIDHIVWILQ